MLDDLLESQKMFFRTGITKDLSFRIEALRKLKEGIKIEEKEILEALRKDLGKSPTEAFTTEVGFVYDSINRAI